MKITKSLVEKIQILDSVPHISVINVFFEDYSNGRGKITIECEGDAWSYFWSAMGEGYTVKSFFLKAGSDYLVRKLSIGINSTIDDDSQEALIFAAKKEILECRRRGEISRWRAKDKWELIDEISDCGKEDNSGILSEIFGCDWYDCLPQKPNLEYQHLYKIVEIIKEAIKSL